MECVFAALPLLFSTALAAPQRFYETRELRFTVELPEHEALALRELVRHGMAEKGVEQIAVVDAEGEVEPTPLGQLSSAELFAVAEVLMDKGATPGSESDLWVTDLNGARVPVTVWWNGKKRMRVAAGPAVDEDALFEIPDQLASWLDQALVDSPNAAWDDRGRAVVAEAVVNLHPEVREQLAGVPFVRVSAPSRKVVARLGVTMTQILQAVYIDDADSARVEVYDAALGYTERFTGTPWNPRREAVRVIAHELAHAVALKTNRAQMAQVRTDNQRGSELVEQHNALVTEMNALITQYNAKPDAALGRKIEGVKARVAELAVEVKGLQGSVQALAQTVQSDRRSRLARALNKVQPFAESPTWYGRTSAEEHFAECYSLFLTDPAALERAAPEIYAWFVAGSHRVLMKGE